MSIFVWLIPFKYDIPLCEYGISCVTNLLMINICVGHISHYNFSYQPIGLPSGLFFLFLLYFLMGFFSPWLLILSFLFEPYLFTLSFLPHQDKSALHAEFLLDGVSVASSPCPVPAVKIETGVSIGFLIRSKSQLPAGSLVKVSSVVSTPFPHERWIEISPAHPTLFQLSFALSVKSWHPGDSRTCSEFNPGEPGINITWLFLPVSCSLSMADVSDAWAILCHDPSSLGPANLYRVGWLSTASRQSSEGRGVEYGQVQAWSTGHRCGLLQL